MSIKKLVFVKLVQKFLQKIGRGEGKSILKYLKYGVIALFIFTVLILGLLIFGIIKFFELFFPFIGESFVATTEILQNVPESQVIVQVASEEMRNMIKMAPIMQGDAGQVVDGVLQKVEQAKNTFEKYQELLP